MSVGTILLLLAGLLVLFGVGQRVLDRLRLTDRQAILFIALIIAGGFLPDIRVTDTFAFNIGGALIPLALCVWLFIKADTSAERVRAIVAPIVTGIAVYALGRLLPADPSVQGRFSCKLEQKEKKPCKSSTSLNLPIVLSLQETHRLQKKMAGRNAAGRITWF